MSCWRAWGQRAHVLGQAGAAEGEPGPQVGRAMFSLVSDRKISITWWESRPSAGRHRADLVAEGHLERVEAVVHVLGHLGHRDRHPEARAGQALVEGHAPARHCARRSPDHGLGRVEEVLHAGRLAQELRVQADPEVVAGPLARRPLQDRDQHVLAGARDHGAAVDHDVRSLVLQRRADLLAGALHVREVEVAVRLAGRAHAHQRHVGRANRLARRRGRRKPALRTAAANSSGNLGLHDRDAARVHQLDLAGVHVHADHGVAALTLGSRRKRFRRSPGRRSISS